MNTAIISVFLFMMFLDFLGGIGGGVWANLAGYDQTYVPVRFIDAITLYRCMYTIGIWN